MRVFFTLREIKTDRLVDIYYDLEEVIKIRLASQYITRIDERDNYGMEERMKKLNDKLKYYSEHYYKNNVSLIDDGLYDKLMKRLEEWEEKNPEYVDVNSMTHKVGSSL